MTAHTSAHRGNSAASRDIAHVLKPYTNLKKHQTTGSLMIARGDGIRVYDEAGKEYIEGMAGLWCASLGFSEKRLAKAAAEAMDRLPFYHSFTHKGHDVAADLAEKLLSIAPVPMSKVFFASSGSEANDTVVKMVWYYNNALGRPQKKKIISRQRAYHGVTVASASLTGLPNNHRSFDLPIANILHVECPHHYRYAEPGESEEAFAARLADSLERRILEEGPDTIAAFIAEPVMGAGGVILPPKGYFARVQEILRKYDILFIADEVICGFHRTGEMWGSQTYGLKPDILTTAKALSAAYLPISAVMVNEQVYQVLAGESDRIGTFGHGFTYTGHPVAAAVALETLRIYEEDRIGEHVKRVSPRFLEHLRRLADRPLVGDARGVGLTGGVELMADKKNRIPFPAEAMVPTYLIARAHEHGVILRPIMDVIAFCPPLIIDEAGIDEMFRRFDLALRDTEAMVAEQGLAKVT
ncbi:MAG TPA: aspartate aminotransferase family protein [Azospirillaceae bacterium]|nr:aspartate aminotransferase family protein [Azospirillaceae bacterium]